MSSIQSSDRMDAPLLREGEPEVDFPKDMCAHYGSPKSPKVWSPKACEGEWKKPEALPAATEEEEPPASIKLEFLAMWAMGWPMVVSFICRIGMASTDSAFVGHLTNSTVGAFLDQPYTAEEYLAAASLSDMVVNILIVPPLAFGQVLNALVGQAVGSGQREMAGTWLQLAVFFLSVSYIPFLVLQYFVVDDALRLLGFSANVAKLSGIYARWNLWWPIPNGIYQCMRFYFQALGLPRPAMWNNMSFLGVNALLNWLFIFGGPFQYLAPTSSMHWAGVGFIGGAMSISVSRCAQPFAYFLYMFTFRKAHEGAWPGLNWSFLQLQRVKNFMAQALPLIGTLIFQSVVGQVTTLLIAQLGTLAIAATSAVAAATQVASSGLAAAFTAVTAVRVGYHLGKGDPEGAKLAARLAAGMSMASTVILVAIMWPLRYQLVGLVTNDPATQPVAATLVAAGMVTAGMAQLVEIGTSGVLSGQGRTLVTTFLSFGFELPASIGGVAILVYVVKLRMPNGLLEINWAQAGIAAVECLVVAVIIGCGNWAKYAKEAQERQGADKKEAEAEEDSQKIEIMSQEHQLRSELLTLKASQLCARARAAGADEADVDAALDAVDPKMAFVELVIKSETETAPRLSVSSHISVGSRFNVGTLAETAGDATPAGSFKESYMSLASPARGNRSRQSSSAGPPTPSKPVCYSGGTYRVPTCDEP